MDNFCFKKTLLFEKLVYYIIGALPIQLNIDEIGRKAGFKIHNPGDKFIIKVNILQINS